MASAVVSSVTNKLGGLLIQEALVLFEVKDHFKWIQEELRMMQCFLKDADSRKIEEERVKEWVAEIIQVSYDAEDVIDTFICSQNALERRRGFAEWVRRCVCIVRELVSELITQYMVSKKIEKIKKRIIDIKERIETYGIRDINEERQEASSWIRDLEGRRRDYVMFEEAQLVGQHEEFRTVRDQLMTEEQRRRVISIFGIGGSGKTALAKKILNDVKDHFDCHALVYVSQQGNIKDVLVRIIKDLERVERDKKINAPEGKEIDFDKWALKLKLLDVDDLGYKLRNEYLRGKRYLVVIDDIWTTDAWDRLILKLPDDGNKSRVLVTTRIRDVALHADDGSGHHHEMRLLYHAESWELFMKKIFPGEFPSPACPSDLEETVRNILKKCGGLPLAILVFGGLLAKRDKTSSAWSRVLESVNRHLTKRSESCMKILALSYWDLPYYLKPCFLYLGLFPEDYEISSRKLIRLWIAEGFIEQRDGELIMEDVAEDYLEELVGRSMIQVVERKPNGLVKKCHLHDLFRDLCISEASQINFFTIYKDNGATSSSTSVRRLAFHGNVDGYEPSKSSTESLRSILYFPDSEVPLSKLLNTRPKLLRVLKTDFKGSSRVPLPEEIGVFAHLRYLEISYDGSDVIPPPPSIGDLSNLQTLYVRGGNLPNAIFNLKQLRHLRAWLSDIDGHPRLENLTNLCTLCLPVGSWMDGGFDKLTNLREFKNTARMRSPRTEAVCDSIQKLHNLELIRLVFGDSWPPYMSFTRHLHLYELILSGSIEKLPELPLNIAKLILSGSELREDAISTLENLSNLKILSLMYDAYISKKMICSSGGFLRLESLTLFRLFKIEELIVEEGAMPVIKSVEFHRLSKLSTTTLPDRVSVLVKRSGA